jgi:putative ABC transport system permease protein
MNWLQRLLRRDRLEGELDAELQFHVDRLVAEYRSAGFTEIEARRRALREFGAVELVKDDCRRVRGTEWLLDIMADARVGARVFSKERGFAFVAVAALALGLGVNTVFFSLVDAFCLSGLPYPSASHLVDLSVRDDAGRRRPFSPAEARAIADLPFIERLGFYVTKPGAVRTSDSVAKRSTVAYVSEDALALIGETPSQGRAFRPEEYRDPHGRIAVLSAELSTELFGSEGAAIGRDIVLDGVSTAVVGVLPKSARFPDNADVWKPVSSLGLADDAPELTLFTRLKTGATALDGAASEIESALRRNATLISDRQRAVVVPLNDRYRGRVTDPVWVAFITAGALVVLIACSNVGNLLLARGARRITEIATRLSLGATRSRIFRQLLTETFVLVAAACAAAVLVSWVALRALMAAIPQGALPYWTSVGLNWRTTAVLLGVGVVTIVLSGMAPAVQLVRLPGVPFNVRTTSHSKAMSRWSSAFLVVQLSVSVLLLCAVGITVQVYRSLTTAGAQTRLGEILSAEVSLSPLRYATADEREEFFTHLRRELTTAGQVVTLSFADALPGTRGTPRTVAAGSIARAGAPVSTIAVDSGYFVTLGLSIMSGRALTDADRDAVGSAVVVNDRFARLVFGDMSVVGQQIRFMSKSSGGSSDDSRVIVGVVASFRDEGALNAPPIVYVPRAPGASAAPTVLMRGLVPPQELAPVLRAAMARTDPDVPLSDVLPLKDATWQARWNGRISQALITAIASVGLSLAMVGVAALTAHRIATRARELSIRVALGATPAQLLRTVLRPIMVQLVLGLVFGGLLAKAWQRAFASPIAASDNLAMVAVLVTAATLVFSAWPARRVAHADPIGALRSDG